MSLKGCSDVSVIQGRVYKCVETTTTRGRIIGMKVLIPKDQAYVMLRMPIRQVQCGEQISTLIESGSPRLHSIPFLDLHHL
jgi:hypothetical protein